MRMTCPAGAWRRRPPFPQARPLKSRRACAVTQLSSLQTSRHTPPVQSRRRSTSAAQTPRTRLDLVTHCMHIPGLASPSAPHLSFPPSSRSPPPYIPPLARPLSLSPRSPSHPRGRPNPKAYASPPPATSTPHQHSRPWVELHLLLAPLEGPKNCRLVLTHPMQGHVRALVQHPRVQLHVQVVRETE